jgi:hypothetical protein
VLRQFNPSKPNKCAVRAPYSRTEHARSHVTLRRYHIKIYATMSQHGLPVSMVPYTTGAGSVTEVLDRAIPACYNRSGTVVIIDRWVARAAPRPCFANPTTASTIASVPAST